ncbi:hypothetical protein V1511DRAFT_447608, partial [Dipodascopsis uninucleata]
KYVGRKFFKEHAQNAFGAEDPYYEEIPVAELSGKKRGSKRKRAIPAGISQNDQKVLKRVRRRAYHMDMSLGLCCCGLSIGWSAVIGIIPGIGDIISACLAILIVRAANKVDDGLPQIVYFKMMVNVAINFGIGLVPFVGDIADAMYKANSRNALLLEEYLRKRGEHNL